MPELSSEVCGVIEGLLRDAGDAAAAAAEAAIEATAPGAGAALARPEVAQLLRTDPLYRTAVEGAGGPVSPEEMEAYFAVRRRASAVRGLVGLLGDCIARDNCGSLTVSFDGDLNHISRDGACRSSTSAPTSSSSAAPCAPPPPPRTDTPCLQRMGQPPPRPRQRQRRHSRRFSPRRRRRGPWNLRRCVHPGPLL